MVESLPVHQRNQTRTLRRFPYSGAMLRVLQLLRLRVSGIEIKRRVRDCKMNMLIGWRKRQNISRSWQATGSLIEMDPRCSLESSARGPGRSKSAIPVSISEGTHKLDYSSTTASIPLLLEENELNTKSFTSRQTFRWQQLHSGIYDGWGE